MKTPNKHDDGRRPFAPNPRGFPKSSSPFGRDDIEKLTPKPRWEYKTKKLRRQEVTDTL